MERMEEEGDEWRMHNCLLRGAALCNAMPTAYQTEEKRRSDESWCLCGQREDEMHPRMWEKRPERARWTWMCL